MNATEFIAKVSAKVRQFDQLNRRCVKLCNELVDQNGKRTDEALSESFTALSELSARAYSLWNEIKFGMAEVGSLHFFDRDVRDIIKQIRDNQDFWVIRVYLTIAGIFNKSADTENKIPTDTIDIILERFDEVFDEFHSWFDINTYYYRKAQIGCVVAALPANRTIDHYYSEIREAYAFTCYRACVALCRALIELALHDALKKKGLLQDSNEIDIETGRRKEFHLGRLLVLAGKNPVGNPIIRGADKDRAWRVKNEAETILHLRDRSDRDDLGVNEDEAFGLIKDTIKVVEAVVSR